jgi:DNA-nicking Smr family endonuclease
MPRLADLKSLLHPPNDHAGVATPSARADKPGGNAKPVVKAKPTVNAKPAVNADIDLTTAFGDVTPLGARAARVRSQPRPVPIARQHLADERDALALSKWGTEPSPATWDIGQEIEAAQTHLRPGLGVDVLARLRRGHWSVQDEVDLHGLTADEAHDALSDFVLAARSRGIRCVRVIHGKGLSSPNREPVLKGKVRRWLAQWDEVLAYCEAPRHAGGGGAVVVLLRAPA